MRIASILRLLSAALAVVAGLLVPGPIHAVAPDTPRAAPAAAADGNRLTYLDGSDPYYVGRDFPKLTTPQWVGEEGVKAVVVLAIDDMREVGPYEAMLRPIIERLKQIDGRGPASIMTNQIDPAHPHLQTWIKEGVSIDTHTFDHPCPLLAGGDFAKAKGTYERCVDLMAAIPGSKAVAFRMPCCDSMNTPSPRFYSGIFDRVTEKGNFLHIDTSVFNITTPSDPELPRELTIDADGREKFRKYVPFDSFVNTIEDYPYPYLINRLCWQFPCATPSDWQAQHLHQPNNPKTVEDWNALIDVTVIKQGTLNLVFHPHGWIGAGQVVEMIDYAQKKHGKAVKFLSFPEVLDRINKHLLAGQSVRGENGQDNGVRLLDLNGDGYQDVVIGNDKVKKTRVWSPQTGTWTDGDFPTSLVTADGANTGARFGVIDGKVCVLSRGGAGGDVARVFTDGKWVADESLLEGLGDVVTTRGGRDAGVRLRDLDADGQCELIVGNDKQAAVYRRGGAAGWSKLRFGLPAGAAIVDAEGRDAGLRFVDVDEDGHDDVIFSNEAEYGLHLFTSMQDGWGTKVLAGKRGEPGTGEELPRIVRAEGVNNGAWFHSRHLWVQNEDTAGMPNLVDRRAFAALLKDVMPGPRTPAAAVRTMRPRPGFEVELMAAEPLVRDPIHVAFGADGKLWVVEMGDYPLGADGKGAPDGRVRYLEDTDGDGTYDKSFLFIDGLGFPTGVTPWRKGVIVTAAPDIFYAEDTDGDGKADKREVLFTGFGEGNQQHRVNGLWYGLDNWFYGANGHSGGNIKSTKTGETVDLGGGRDFRVRPETGAFDPQPGATQYGRAMDDWGNWFGCDNSSPNHHYPIGDHYLRRNPHLTPPNPRIQVGEVPHAPPIFPASRTLTRFNEPHSVNRITSGNGLVFYRDDLFGEAFAHNTFLSEPVHNLVYRQVVTPDGITFKGRRAADEQNIEFLASTDNWFRPTGLRVGPDGALWVADMYRLVIEHPEWIPKEWQERLDLRAGRDKGRIWRVFPTGKKPRPIPNLAKLDAAGLVAALDSPSGWQRDMAQQVLVERKDKTAVPHLEKMATGAERSLARLHALCTLDGLGALTPDLLKRALDDKHPGVVRHAIRLSEPLLNDNPKLAEAVAKHAGDDDPQVRLQLALSLGEWKHERAGEVLGKIALRAGGEPYLTAAALSSLSKENLEPMMRTVLADGAAADGAPALLQNLLRVAGAMGNSNAVAALLTTLGGAPAAGVHPAERFSAIGNLLDTLDAAGTPLSELAGGGDERVKKAVENLSPVFDAARKIAADPKATEEQILAATRLLGRAPGGRQEDVTALSALLSPQSPEPVQTAAIDALGRLADDAAAAALLKSWRALGPAPRGRALDALLGRAEWSETLMAALEQGTIRPAEVDAARRQRLFQHESEAIRGRANTVFAETVKPDRQKVIEAYQPALDMEGDASKGAQVFAKLCAACHRLGDVGNPVGPDLAALRDKSPEFLLVSILDPNRAMEAQFTNYAVQTKKGRVVSGIIRSETGGSVTLVEANGQEQNVLRGDIKALRSTGVSLMPEGLEVGLTPQDMADLIAHVRAAGPAPQPKTFPGNTPQPIRPAADGGLPMPASKAELFGPNIVFEEKYANIGYWSGADNYVTWIVEPARPGKYAVWLEWACDDSTAGNEFLVTTGSQRLTGKVKGTGTWDEYKREKVGEVTLRLGKQRVTFRSAGAVTGSLIDLKSIELIPVSRE